MVDIKHIQQFPEKYQEAIKNKHAAVDLDLLLDLAARKTKLQQDLEAARQKQNQLASEIKSLGKPRPELIERGRDLKNVIKQLEADFNGIETKYLELLTKVPNLPSVDTPVGKDETENVVLRSWGKLRDFAAEGFEPKEHWELGEALGVIDLERAVKISGSRFAYLKGDLALMQFALMQFALAKVTNLDFISELIKEKQLEIKPKAFIMVVPPVLIKPEPFGRMARLEPREERYHIPGDDLYLIGSAEHTLGAMYMDEVLAEEDLPLRYLGYSTSFRREAGSYGKDMKGILRVHQFDKLEMEVFSTAGTAYQEQELLVAIQEKLMQLLKIPYQVIAICTGDMGTPDERQFDINAWLPGQNKYRETHTSDLMGDYQARRLNTRVKLTDGSKELVHMNDATLFAIGRALIAIMENYQQQDGSITIPEVLQPYMGGKVAISKI